MFYKFNKNMLAVEEYLARYAPKTYSTVYRELIAGSSRQGILEISQSIIAEKGHMSVSTVKRAVKYLAKHYLIGIANVKGDSKGTPNVYVLNPNLISRFARKDDSKKAYVGEVMGFNVHIVAKANKQLAHFINNFNDLHKKYSFSQPDFSKIRKQSEKIAKKILPKGAKPIKKAIKPKKHKHIASIDTDTGELLSTPNSNLQFDLNFIKEQHVFRCTRTFKKSFIIYYKYSCNASKKGKASHPVTITDIQRALVNTYIRAKLQSLPKLSSKPYYFITILEEQNDKTNKDLCADYLEGPFNHNVGRQWSNLVLQTESIKIYDKYFSGLSKIKFDKLMSKNGNLADRIMNYLNNWKSAIKQGDITALNELKQKTMSNLNSLANIQSQQIAMIKQLKQVKQKHLTNRNQ